MTILRAFVAAILALAVGAAAAYADKTVYTQPGTQSFFTDGVTIAQGEKVTFTNTDFQGHDVTAVAKGADGKPLFASGLTGPGDSNPVAGAEYLTTGEYDFVCTIHPGMDGTLTVTAEGTPQQHPPEHQAPPQQQASAADTTAPQLSVKVLDTKRSKIRKRRSLQLALTTDEPAAVRLTARSGRTVVASGTKRLAKAGTKKVSVKLTKAGLRLVKRSKPVRIAVAAHAVDASGNEANASASGRLR